MLVYPAAGPATYQRQEFNQLKTLRAVSFKICTSSLSRHHSLLSMEENIFPERPTSKLYTENAIRIATFLGGPLIAGYLIADNYKQLGETEKIKTTWMIAIIATVLLFVIAWFLPEKTPPYLLPIPYTVGAYYLAQNLQGAKIKAHIAAGGQTWSIWRAVVAGLVGFVIIVAIVFAAFILMDQYFV